MTLNTQQNEQLAKDVENDGKVFEQNAPWWMLIFSVFLFFVIVAVVVVYRSFVFSGGVYLQFLEVMHKFRQLIEYAGWSMISFAVAFVAIAVTAMTILGLDGVEKGGSRQRRKLIAEIANYSMIIAFMLLSFTVVTVFFSMFGQMNVSSLQEVNEVVSVPFFVLLAVACPLFLVTWLIYENLSKVAMSDAQWFKNEREKIAVEKNRYDTRRGKVFEKYKDVLPKLEKTKEASVQNLDLTIFTAIKMSVKAIFVSVFCVVVASIPAGIIITCSRDNASREIWIFIMMLTGFQALCFFAGFFGEYSFFQPIQQDQKPIVKIGKFLKKSIIFFPLVLFLPIVAAQVQFETLELERMLIWIPAWVIMFGVPFLPFWLPKRWSWQTVSAFCAIKECEDRLEILARNEDDLKNQREHLEVVEASEQRAPSTSEGQQEIIALLKKLVEQQSDK